MGYELRILGDEDLWDNHRSWQTKQILGDESNYLHDNEFWYTVKVKDLRQK